MQCYESEALRLKLYSDTCFLMPDTVYDPLTIDEVLADTGVHSMRYYLDLDPGKRTELARRLNRMCPGVARACVA